MAAIVVFAMASMPAFASARVALPMARGMSAPPLQCGAGRVAGRFAASRRGVACARASVRAADTEEPDIVEKMFKFFFGEQEARPMGMGRTSGAPDTYPATLTESAEPVAGDSREAAELRPLLKNTNLETRKLKVVYDAGRHGWSARAFHQKVDGTGPCIMRAVTKGGCVCGAYAPKGFAGIGEYRGSIAAFLFTWPDGPPCTFERVIKLQKAGGASLATIDIPESGPRFGADGLAVPLEDGSARKAFCKLGPYYKKMPDGSGSLFGPRDNPQVTELKELRMYAGVYAEDERIPFSGAIPFAIE